MRLNKELKYEFDGDIYAWVWGWDGSDRYEFWESPVHNFDHYDFDFLSDRGLVKVHETSESAP